MVRQIVMVWLVFSMNAAFALDQVKIALDWYVNPDHAPLLVAEAKGYFKEEDIKVEFLPPSDAALGRQLLATGQVDLSLTYLPGLLISQQQGLPIVWFGNLIDTNLDCLAVLEQSNIEKIKQLRGKIIGYVEDGVSEKLLFALLKNHELSQKDVQLVNIHMNASQALLSNKVDAVWGMMRNVEPVELKEQGIKTRLFLPTAKDFPNYPALIFAVKKGQSNQDKLVRFKRAYQKGLNELKTHPNQSWRLAKKHYESTLATTPKIAKANQAIWQATWPLFSTTPFVYNKQQYQDVKRFILQ